MIKTFIDDVLINILETGADLSRLSFVLPSKRAGNFLKSSISKFTDRTLFSPDIFSIEEFIEHISLLKSIPNTELLFELYNIYIEVTPEEQVDDFTIFCKWAQIIIQDFNEIDRYLIPSEEIFTYLSAIKEVDHWSVSNEKTELIKKYLSFWEKLPIYYKKFTRNLISKGFGYQGLLYREAVEKLELYIQHNSKKRFVFLGFNALNNAEQKIIQELLHQGVADIYWDFDSHFIDSKFHDAGLFARQHKQWKYFQKNTFKWSFNNYKSEKDIHIIGVPKNIGQAKYVGELLFQRRQSNNNLLNTAVILGDESLLNPLLNSIPSEIGPVNVTMGMPLHLAPLASLFDSLFQLHKTTKNSKIYFKDIISITSSPYVAPILNISKIENTAVIHNYLSKNNITHVKLEKLKSLFVSNKSLIESLFGSWRNSSKVGLENCKGIIQQIKNHLSIEKKDNLLALEYLFKFNQVFNQIIALIDKYDYAKDIKTLMMLYKEVLSLETLDFQGEALKGLQIIGMLESRVIDFETIIITSVNEGVLPSGKSNNSFIPFDVKLDYGLPTYKEKDAVYAYHFYHLLQRAKNVYILYNTEVDALNGGEKSRFITQLEVEGVHDIKHYSIAPEVPSIKKGLKSIKKTEDIMTRLKDISSKGFSPSSLTSYIRNPIDFYYQKILGINTFDDVEENVASNTLGTIIHNTLEDLYLPLIGKNLTIDNLSKMKTKIDDLVKQYFAKEFKDGDTTSGKNLIVFEITKRYISNFINTEIEFIRQGNNVEILALEKELKASINLPELGFPVCLKGTVDRIDKCNGILRIIDYKTGRVEQNKVEIVDWKDLITDYTKYSKSFQILAYAYMMHIEVPFENSIEAGIISFKNLKQGLLKFGKKDAPKSRNKDNSITKDTLNLFSYELKKLICEICNPEIDFIEKEA